MVLTRFSASRFRNIDACDLTFSPGVNLFLGENAQGKTNVLEGIYLFARGKSFRAAADRDLTKFGESGFSLKVIFETSAREESLAYSYENGSRRREKNGAPARLSDMMGRFRAVLFHPEDLQIVKGGPEKRREFLNVALSQTDAAYIGYYSRYTKVLENRNALLRAASKGLPIDRTELEAWSEGLASLACEIYKRRMAYLTDYSPLAEGHLHALSCERERLTLTYRCDGGEPDTNDISDFYHTLFLSHLEREMCAGCTLFGVHRDDIEISLGEKSAKQFASQGQQRSIVLSMKLAEGDYAARVCGEVPVFLFDDVMSELDDSRRAYLMRQSEGKQLIMTACEKSIDLGECYEIDVKGGTYVPAYRER